MSMELIEYPDREMLALSLASKLAGQKNLRVYALAPDESQALAGLAARNMRLQCTIQDGVIWLGNDSSQVELKPRLLFGPDQ